MSDKKELGMYDCRRSQNHRHISHWRYVSGFKTLSADFTCNREWNKNQPNIEFSNHQELNFEQDSHEDGEYA